MGLFRFFRWCFAILTWTFAFLYFSGSGPYSTEPEFNTQYEVTYINVAGQEITRIYYLPNGINAIEVTGDRGNYSMYVIYDNLKRKEMIENAVIDVLSFKKLTNINH